MARATRVVLDLALISLSTIRPAVSKVWGSTKGLINNTPVKVLVTNPIVWTVENTIDKLALGLINKIEDLRDRALPAEKTYLENQLRKVNDRIEESKASSSKTLKPKLGIAWEYAKTEVAPPMTLAHLHGPFGKKLEDSVSKFANGFIANIENRIKEIDAEEARVIKEKEAAILAAQVKAKEAAKKREEERKKEAEAQKAAEAKKAQAKKAAAVPKEEKKADPPKASKAKTEPPKAAPEKPKPKKDSKK